MSPKENVVEQLEFELAYYDVTVKHVNHNAPSINIKGLLCLSNGISAFVGYFFKKKKKR